MPIGPNTDVQEIVREERVNIPMRDGTLLAASVTRPAGDATCPAILTRTPYDRTNQALAAEMWARAGYAFVRQDVRGRFDSEGEFYPFRDDPADGEDTLGWVAAQPWSNGRVGMTGASHVGTVQYLAASGNPAHLTAAIPEFAPVSVHDRWWYQGGAFRLGFNLAWVTLLAQDNLRHFPGRLSKLAEDRAQAWVSVEDMLALRIPPLYRDWKLPDYTTVQGAFGNRWFEEFLEHADYGPFWEPYDFRRVHQDMATPMLHVGGWYDTFCQGTIDSFVGLRNGARTEAARNAQRLIVGPWRHVNWGQRDVGELDFGQDLLSMEPFAVRKRWFDHWLNEDAGGLDGAAPVQIFVMGANAWRAEESWPLERAIATPFYLHTDGSLDQRLPQAETPRSYDYDPRDPVITLGGCEWVNYPCGPFDQRPLDGRHDILRFQTEPLDTEIEVTGQVFAHVWCSSSATDTDFTAKLIDVHPDGRAYNVCDGILRARYRDSSKSQTLMEADRPYEFVIDLWSTSNVFGKGHRIRLDVSSSNFPRFDANQNTGYFAVASEDNSPPVVAHNTVYFDREHLSHVILPIVPAQ